MAGLIAIFASVCALSAGYFLFARRTFDFSAVAFGGAIFYFMPLFVGEVLVLQRGQNTTIVPELYWVGIGVVISIMVFGVASERYNGRIKVGMDLTPFYIIISAVSLLVALDTSPLLSINKTETLRHVGYFYIAFQISAALAAVTSTIHRKWTYVSVAACLLAVDVAIGFRAMSIISFIGCCFVLLRHHSASILVRRLPRFGFALLLMVVAMLFSHSIRYFVADLSTAIKIDGSSGPVSGPALPPDAIQPSAPKPTEPGQFDAADAPSPAPMGPRGDIVRLHPVDVRASASSSLMSYLSVPAQLLRRSEPFSIQSIFNEVARSEFSCRSGGMWQLLLIAFPQRLAIAMGFPVQFFEEEFKPVLFPDVDYGLAGNLWAEMLCHFGWAGVIGAIVGFGFLLFILNIGLLRCPGDVTPAFILCGVVLSFYIHRSDLFVTLVMIRQIALVFGAAWLAKSIWDRVQKTLAFKRRARGRTY